MADFVSSILLCFAMLGVISVISIFCSLHDAIVFFRFVSNRQPSQPKVLLVFSYLVIYIILSGECLLIGPVINLE